MTSTAQQASTGSTSALPANARGDGNGRIVWRRLLQRKLLIRLTIPTLIGFIQLALAIMAIVTGQAPVIVLLWALPALLVGFWFGRKTKIAWNSDNVQVSLIQAQILLAVAYLLVRFGTHWVLERTLDGRAGVADVVLIVSFGLFFGRSIGLAMQIWHALVSRDSQEHVDASSA